MTQETNPSTEIPAAISPDVPIAVQPAMNLARPEPEDWIWPVAIMALLACVAYLPVLKNGYIWDDDYYIRDNAAALKDFNGLESIWLVPTTEPQYYPLTHTTFWIEHQLWGTNPVGYHVDNVLLHLGCGIMLWRLLLRLKVPGAYAAAVLFVVHPVHVESVAWGTERKNVLSGFLYMLSLWAYLHTDWGKWILQEEDEPETPKSSGTQSRDWYLISLALFVGSLLSKSVTSSLPCVILLLAWWKRGRIRKQDVYPMIPMLVAGLAMSSVTSWMEKNNVGAVGILYQYPPLQRVCIAGRAIWFYLGKLLWPHPLIFVYPKWAIARTPALGDYIYPAAVVLTAGVLWALRKKISRGPLTAFLFFCGSLIPALGFVNIFPMRYYWVADHYQYLASLGPIVLIAALATHVLAAIPDDWKRPVEVVVGCGVAGVLALTANAQCKTYLDAKTLWMDIIAKNPDCAMAHNNYAQRLIEEKDYDGAEKEIQLSLQLDPDDVNNHISMGNLFKTRGDFDKAIPMYEDALKYAPGEDEPAARRARALIHYDTALAYGAWADDLNKKKIEPGLAERCTLESIAEFHKCIDINPAYQLPHHDLGVRLAASGDLDGAIAEFRNALQTMPDCTSCRVDLAHALANQGKLDDAVREFRTALQYDPTDTQSLDGLGEVMLRQGNLADAAEKFGQALRINPDDEAARADLAEVNHRQNSGGH